MSTSVATTPKKRSRRQFTRKVKIYELKVFRNWIDLEKARPTWKYKPNDADVSAMLFIHEVFALEAWRKRDGGRSKVLPPFNTETIDELKEDWKRAEAFLADGEDIVAEHADGAQKAEMAACLEWMQIWLEKIREILEEGENSKDKKGVNAADEVKSSEHDENGDDGEDDEDGEDEICSE